MRQILALFAAFTIGTLASALHYERKQDGMEHAYHSGYDEGWRDASTVPRTITIEPTEVIEEDDPRWDCRTMGNRQCGTGVAK